MDPTPWLVILKSLPLSKPEIESVAKFEKVPTSKIFFACANILKKYGLDVESTELLLRGVHLHPDYEVARIALARTLYEKGLVQQARDTLERCPSSLIDNLVAQGLKFKLGVLYQDQEMLRQALRAIKFSQHADASLQETIKIFETAGLLSAREFLLKEFAEKLVTPVLEDRFAASSEKLPSKAAPLPPPEVSHKPAPPLDGLKTKTAQGFHVIAAKEVFFGESTTKAAPFPEEEATIDSVTMGEIYENQGHFKKAFNLYKKLLMASPRNEFLRKKVLELSHHVDQQVNLDLVVDPLLVAKMSAIDDINRKIKFLDKLCLKL